MLTLLFALCISTTITISEDKKIHEEAGLPQSVSHLFIADAAICPSNPIDSQLQNCWANYPKSTGQNHNYSPNKISFNGVTADILKTNNGNIKACCYKYQSIYMGTENCKGLPSIQKHLTFQIDCHENEYHILNTDSSITSGLDYSTCYKGIQIDSICDNKCEYEVCIEYLTIDIDTKNNNCPVINGWVLDKTADSFSFNSLYGIPSCTQSKTSKHSNIDANMRNIFYRNGTVIFSQIIVVMFICMCGVFVYCTRNSVSKDTFESGDYPWYRETYNDNDDNECYQKFENI